MNFGGRAGESASPKIFLVFERTKSGYRLVIGRSFAAVLIAIVAAINGSAITKPIGDYVLEAIKYLHAGRSAPQDHPAKSEILRSERSTFTITSSKRSANI
jgi:hypothetical protein